MADTIVTVNIHAKTANTDNGWIPAPVAKQSPVLNYDADLNTTLSLLNFPNVFIYDASSNQIINKNNLQTYYPEYNPGGGGGGGGSDTPITGLTAIRKLSDAEYAALSTKDAQTLYVVQYSDRVELYLGEQSYKDPAAVHSSTVDYLEGVTQSQYDALDPPDNDTIYAIKGATT
jgi:hypothetical protein